MQVSGTGVGARTTYDELHGAGRAGFFIFVILSCDKGITAGSRAVMIARPIPVDLDPMS